ncbi:MAG: thiol reductant ABC exporter subunit CydD [Granulosicoccus sp.]
MATSEFLQSLKKRTGKYFYLSVVLGLFSGIFIVFQAWLLALVVNSILFKEARFADVAMWMTVLPVIFVVRAALTWASEISAFEAAALVKQHLRIELQKHLFATGPVELGGEHSGKVASVLVDGVEAMENYFARYLPAMTLLVLVPSAILVVVFPIDWISGIVLLITAPLIPFFMVLIGKGTERLNSRQWRKLARMNAYFLDMIQGMGTLKLFNASRTEALSIATISEGYRKATMSVLRVAFLSSMALEFLATVGIALIAVLIGFRLFYGEMSFFHGFFVLLLAPEFYLPLRNMGTHYHARLEAMGAAENMIEIFNRPTMINAQQHSTDKNLAVFEQYPGIDIVVTNVHYSYMHRGKVLDGVSMRIPQCQRTALVGYSGAGKSTVAQLLLGFIQPDQGNVLVNGVELKDIGIKHWQRRVAWISQRPYIFYGSIRANICLGTDYAGEDALYKAASSACIHDYIQSLPDGYETVIGEKGAGLSGGQVQRIALARAFIKDAPFVILDEATASLDKNTELLIQHSINLLAENRTLLVIAHRLTTIENADSIIVLDAGEVVDSGTHQSLIQKKGLYRKLHRTLKQAEQFA